MKRSKLLLVVALISNFGIANAADGIKAMKIPKLLKVFDINSHHNDILQLKQQDTVIIPDATNSQVIYLDTNTLQVRRRLSLGSTPEILENNSAADRLVVFGDKKSTEVSQRRFLGIPLGMKRKDISIPSQVYAAESLSKKYTAFCVASNEDFSRDDKIVVYDHKTRKVVSEITSKWPDGNFGCSLMAYDSKASTLYTGEKGISPFSLYAFNVDAQSMKLTRLGEQLNFGITSNASAIIISNRNMVVASGTGNYPERYNLTKYNLDDLSDKKPTQFKVGAYPTIAAFSTDGSLFTAINHESVKIFTTDAEKEIKNYKREEIKKLCGQYGYGNILALAFNEAGNKLVGIMSCDRDEQQDLLFVLDVQ